MTASATLPSFVPIVVRRRLLAGDAPAAGTERLAAAVLAADVSGFTQLVGSLHDAPGGIDELSDILNDGFGRLIDAVDATGGDVLGFAGDSLLAFWPAGPDGSAAVATAAAAAALDAQRRLASGDLRIRVRIGLSLGEIALSTVGGVDDRWLLVASGPAPAEAAAIQARAELGEVVVTGAFEDAAGSAIRTAEADGVRRLVDMDAERKTVRPGSREDAADAAIEASALVPYLPAAVVSRLEAGHDQYLSELRTITAVFIRVADLGQGDDVSQLQEAVAAIQSAVHRYEGTITAGVDEKGVTVVAAFGMPPEAHEDDVDRALSAARSLDLALGSLERPHGIGVATGLAFCGPKGNDTRREYTALSDAVNVAARLAHVAGGPGRPPVLCDPATVEAGRARWTFETAVSLRLKGKTELLTAYGLQQRLARTALATAGMVGRSAELAAIERAATAPSARTGRLVAIEGEPGMGKTSLLAAAAEALARSAGLVAIGYADPLERSVPFQAWSTVFATILDVDPDEPETAAPALSERVGARAPLLSPVLGLDLDETDETAPLAGEARLAATRTLLIELLTGAIERHARLHVLLEDAHWFDSASWALLADAVRLPGLAAVVTTRPEEMARSRGSVRSLAGTEVEVIRLAPLSAHEINELARLRLGAEEVDGALQALLLDTCKGNPFFTVEVMSALSQRGVLAVGGGRATLSDETVVVPDSIQAAITSRIDGLSADEQLCLKVASVIGSPFEVDLLARLHPTGRPRERIEEDLLRLGGHDLVLPIEEGSCDFRHALTREVAYGLMLGEQRRDLHRSLAELYEAEPEVGDQLYPVLAHHWLRAENDDKAVGYLTRAAVASLAHGMPREAVDHGVRAARVLGIELETDPERIRAILPGELAEIERLMAGRRPRDLDQLPELIDESIGMGIGIVLQAMPSAHQSLQTELFALMAIRNLNLTLRFGAGILAPGVYAMYSIVLRGLGADSATAYEFSELARTVDAANGHPLAAAVAFVHVWFNNTWHQPLASGIDIAMAGADAGLAGPDPLYGSFNLAAATTALATSGAPLAEVVAMGEAHLARIGDRSATAAFHNRLEAQMARALIGETSDLTSLSDGAFDEAELAAMAETSNFNQTAYYYIAKLRLHYLAGDPHAAVAWADRAFELLPSFAAQPGQGELVVLAALARLGDLSSEPVARGGDVAAVGELLGQLETWAATCPANFVHKEALVRGELAAVEGDLAAADAAFAEAIASATEHGFRQWAALAAERRAHAASMAGDPAAAGHRAEAVERYRDWGALRVAGGLETEAVAATR